MSAGGSVSINELTAALVPEKGQLVLVRDRHWVVSEVSVGSVPIDEVSSGDTGIQHFVSLVSVEDDGSTDDLEVIWEVEPGAEILETATLPQPVVGGFDEPNRLAAFLDAVRWGAVTSVDAKSLQAPFRSGIQIEDYQLDPVVRALRMPRVNLLVADDVGLGKTIEAGLVIQELLLRHRARTVMIACPAALCLKWQSEMSEKFGLDFKIVDAAMLRELRRTRGLGANPFRVFPRLIVSIDWLKRPRAMGLIREVLPADAHTFPRRFDLLVIDEVHQCAPSGRGKYAIDSQRTTAIRELSPHFEHRLFLSATPHNGYTESFTALLELLDPQRFARGITPKPETLASAIVRRLKGDIVNADGSPRFAKRVVEPLEVSYPQTEIDVHAALSRYSKLRREETRASGARGTADLVTLLLKKRLFSSPAAFASTLELHRRTLAATRIESDLKDIANLFDKLDEDFDDDVEAAAAEEEALTAAARVAGATTAEQEELLNEMTSWAELNRHRADAKTERLIEWVKETCCPKATGNKRVWNDERIIIFTEYRTTQMYLAQLFEAHGLGGDRLEQMYGGMDTDARERIKAEFQHDPKLRPVRILLATDAASEGIDLQRHCHRLVHVEIPFSPTKLEQRNGRIDRHGQPASEVLIHHFVASGWRDATPQQWEGVANGTLEADLAFLSLIARKIDTIRDDLGTAGPVLAEQVEAAMLGRAANPNAAAPVDRNKAARALNRLERDLRTRIAELRDQLDESIAELHLSPQNVERVVNAGLEIANQPPLRSATLTRGSDVVNVFEVPQLTRSWASATRDLYDPIADVVRPITFDHAVATDADDVVLAHLNHRLVAQAMRTLRAEIWSSGAETRMGRVSVRQGGAGLEDLGVVAFARLVLVGGDGRRLHEEVITAGGRVRNGNYARWNIGETEKATQEASYNQGTAQSEAHIAAVWPRIADNVYLALEARAKERVESLQRRLIERQEADIEAITTVLTDLKENIGTELARVNGETKGQLTFDFNNEEKDQFERNGQALQRRLDEIPEEILRESDAVRSRYAAPTPRLFPAAIEFLMPSGGIK
jgi:superfamily II DNA or RNA helicase